MSESFVSLLIDVTLVLVPRAVCLLYSLCLSRLLPIYIYLHHFHPGTRQYLQSAVAINNLDKMGSYLGSLLNILCARQQTGIMI